MTKSVLFYLIVTLFVVLSCGERITSHSRTIIDSDTLRYSDIIELKQNSKLSEIGSLIPIDNTKPMFVDGKLYFNASVTFGKVSETNVLLNKKESLSYDRTESDISNKETKKTDNANMYIGLFFVFCLFVYGYFKGWF